MRILRMRILVVTANTPVSCCRYNQLAPAACTLVSGQSSQVLIRYKGYKPQAAGGGLGGVGGGGGRNVTKTQQ